MKWLACMVKGSAADVEAAAEAAAGGISGAGPACPDRRAATILYKVADILDRKFDQIAADMTREEGKTLPEAKGEVRRSINIFRYFAGEGSRMPGMLVPVRARSRPHVRDPQADRRGRPDHAVEFPQRDSGMETGSRADLRQHGADEACVGRAAERVADLWKLP